MEGEYLYNFVHKATWNSGNAYEITNLNEAEWGLPAIENKRSSIPIVFDLFPTYPAVNAHGVAITYLTAKRSIGTLPYQYLNKNHIMKGEYITEDFKADHDTILGTMLAARLADEPAEPGVFIDKPATCKVLGIIWVLSEHGEIIAQKMREAIAKGEKEKFGASYECYFNDFGFVWRGKIYQDNYIENATDAGILANLKNCVGTHSDGTIYVASPYGGEKPVLLAGGADGFVFFHGAGIIDDTVKPAHGETKGQFNLLARREIPAYIAHAGLIRYVETKNQEERVEITEEMRALFGDFKEDIVKAVAGLVKTPEGDKSQPVDEKAIAETFEKVLTAKKEEFDAKFAEAVAKAAEEKKPEIEKGIRDKLEAEAKAYAEILTKCQECEVEIKDEVADGERAVAKAAVQEFAKEPETAMTKLKAKIFDLPNDKQPERTTKGGMPTGGNGGQETSPFQTPEEIEQEVDN